MPITARSAEREEEERQPHLRTHANARLVQNDIHNLKYKSRCVAHILCIVPPLLFYRLGYHCYPFLLHSPRGVCYTEHAKFILACVNEGVANPMFDAMFLHCRFHKYQICDYHIITFQYSSNLNWIDLIPHNCIFHMSNHSYAAKPHRFRLQLCLQRKDKAHTDLGGQFCSFHVKRLNKSDLWLFQCLCRVCLVDFQHFTNRQAHHSR